MNSSSKRSPEEAKRIANLLRDRYISPEAQTAAQAALKRLHAQGLSMPTGREMMAQRASAALGLGTGGATGNSGGSVEDDRRRAREILDRLRDHYGNEN